MARHWSTLTLLFLITILATEITHAQLAPNASRTTNVYLPLITTFKASSSPPSADALTNRVVTLTNEHRIAHGCAPLTIDPKLAAAAQAHSQDMATNDYFNHTCPAGSSTADRVTIAGYAWSRVAENIAAGHASPETVVQEWMQSPGHRDNILNCALREIGVGYYYQADDRANVRLSNNSIGGPYGSYWTQVLAAPR